MISCRRSTVEFFSVLFVSSLVLVIAVRSLFSIRRNGGGEGLVYKRDRSLGGKVVAVGKRENDWSTSRASTSLSSESSEYYYQKQRDKMKSSSRRRKEELPQWWPQVVSQGPMEVENKEEYQRLANQLIQGWCQFMFYFVSLTLHDWPSAVRKERSLCIYLLIFMFGPIGMWNHAT